MKLRIKPKELKVLFLVYLAPFLLIGLMWNWLPEKIPMHIDAETASITSYYSPLNHLLFFGGINLVLMLLLALDKRSLTFKVIGMVIFSLIALSSPLIALFDASREQFMRAIFLFLSSVIITLGFLMRTEKPERNVVFGIRIPYTFKSDKNWRRAMNGDQR